MQRKFNMGGNQSNEMEKLREQNVQLRNENAQLRNENAVQAGEIASLRSAFTTTRVFVQVQGAVCLWGGALLHPFCTHPHLPRASHPCEAARRGRCC